MKKRAASVEVSANGDKSPPRKRAFLRGPGDFSSFILFLLRAKIRAALRPPRGTIATGEGNRVIVTFSLLLFSFSSSSRYFAFLFLPLPPLLLLVGGWGFGVVSRGMVLDGWERSRSNVVDFYVFVISPSQDTLLSELIFIKYERLILSLSREKDHAIFVACFIKAIVIFF